MFIIRLANCKPFSTLRPATTKDPAAGLRAHPLTKPMGPLPTAVIRLIRTLHSLGSPDMLIRSRKFIFFNANLSYYRSLLHGVN